MPAKGNQNPGKLAPLIAWMGRFLVLRALGLKTNESFLGYSFIESVVTGFDVPLLLNMSSPSSNAATLIINLANKRKQTQGVSYDDA